MAIDLKQLDQHLAKNSYVDAYNVSQADVFVYNQLGSAPSSEYQNVTRWYNHISSFKNEFATLGGGAFAASLYGSVEGSTAPAAAAAAAPAAEKADDDEIDLFGSDEEEDPEAERIKAERVAAYNEKKSKKPKAVQKSVVTFDVKPWDNETDMKQLEENMRALEIDGLTWGLSKLVPVGYGVNKLQVTLVVEDDKVSLEELQEQVEADEDHVQSTDIAAMQKL
ncbi:hypothetical protein E3Q22_04097 [Wallemia mellicola]|uniref:Elongation factor 1-beta n=2 Tax=Wallemia mellicola TaxID=1708541 RepID=A0A4T0TH97_9BASI|nr:hypothetical protein WALSEDRAFT_61280 [Wallemia mellicola CBS 633.66]TIB70681.1 hypothetical protein E3Q23_04084 [Wallemia mellicola]EIM19781.1 hypothetical protein WALSEDRAFT_61280 [Wallemia mellicola CBS 633.66]TIB74981.1 hypothetical protein E3Q22_04097 [Wallemia mellicola]TIB79816.1 hypothetical protein E3Q21_04057 [Wallemia mellicola]TIB83751.1 hypothetical protein E3Q20_04010 [Wallemia mellicola]|eukprot:XP_006960115.1 hypothetical protein WALSEDRAFT_61280 [Wallemia mellicola CBS 633.66]